MKKYKIAILTQPLGFNYGGIIQNYALQKVLTDFGFQVCTINRSANNPYSKLRIKISRTKVLFYKYVLGKRMNTFLDYKSISANNLKFIKKYIKISSELSSTNALKDHFKRMEYDAVIVGSDQVWRPKYSYDIFNYYLDFLEKNEKIRKISYAASFGVNEWEYDNLETEKCSKLIQQFDAVSVRERSGVELCEKHLNRKGASHVLDPTLLLTANDYSKLINNYKNDIGLFTYILDFSEEKKQFITNCSNILNLKTHSNQAKKSHKDLSPNKDINDFIIPPISDWLKGFRDAEFIITDSFHGMVFSIINQKPFFVIVNNNRGASRFESLLSQLEIEKRLIYNIKDFNFENLKNPIDYESVFNKLNNLKNDSIAFLKQNLK